MSKLFPPPTDSQVAHTEHLLQLLKEVSARNPPGDLRERIVEMESAQRKSRDLFPMFRWEFATPTRRLVVLLAASAALVIAALLNVIDRPTPPLTVRMTAPELPKTVSVPAVTVRVRPIRLSRARHTALKPSKTLDDRLTLLLPYSNADVSTGTTTTIRISIPQTQLIALGLPLPIGGVNSRIAADVALGDDGMPKAISLPLPLQVVKEN